MLALIRRQGKRLSQFIVAQQGVGMWVNDRFWREAGSIWRKVSLRARLGRLEKDSHGSRATFVGNNRVLVKIVAGARNISYYVEADDRLLAPGFITTGRYETALTNFVLREIKRDSHCLDVGSNFGYFTCLMARFCPEGRVIGIEPDQHVFELLRDNIAINGLYHARAVRAAASDRDQDITLFRRQSRSGNTSIAAVGTDFTESLGEEPVQPFVVPGVRIDSLAQELDGRLDLMKIDVEGAEPLVIAGARQTIESNPQLSIVMEWSPGQVRHAGFDVGEFLRSLAALGLRTFDVRSHRIAPISHDALINIPYRAGIVLRR